MRVHWKPEYHRPGSSVSAEPGEPILCTFPRTKAIMSVELNSGVLGHAAARRLEGARWRIDQGSVEHGVVVVAAVAAEKDGMARLRAVLDGCRVVALPPAVAGAIVTGHEVDFLEIFAGSQTLTRAVKREGVRVGLGDRHRLRGLWNELGPSGPDGCGAAALVDLLRAASSLSSRCFAMRSVGRLGSASTGASRLGPGGIDDRPADASAGSGALSLL